MRESSQPMTFQAQDCFPTPYGCTGARSWGSWPGRNLREIKHLVWWLLVTSRFSFSS